MKKLFRRNLNFKILIPVVAGVVILGGAGTYALLNNDKQETPVHDQKSSKAVSETPIDATPLETAPVEPPTAATEPTPEPPVEEPIVEDYVIADPNALMAATGIPEREWAAVNDMQARMNQNGKWHYRSDALLFWVNESQAATIGVTVGMSPEEQMRLYNEHVKKTVMYWNNARSRGHL